MRPDKPRLAVEPGVSISSIVIQRHCGKRIIVDLAGMKGSMEIMDYMRDHQPLGEGTSGRIESL